ncbi:MAG: hypothetical protein BGO28_04500 [Alphaproteobacteria bacterium 43-37]|nr:MAG: hypothetical protein BGO28_04500 [Alphaproteobacteria bacterium 43-37]
MQTCLAHPEYGFYSTLKSVNEHFTTSPEISPLFGEAISAFFVNFYQSQPQQKVRLIELGPGNGTLAFDILSCWKKLTTQNLYYVAVESSPSLTKIQQTKLQPFAQSCHWVRSVKELDQQTDSSFVNFIIANEFFDALPIRQFFKTNDQWFERVVTTCRTDLVFDSIPFKNSTQIAFPESANFYEICEDSIEIMKDISALMIKSPSICLIIDYGYETHTDYKDTLQAIRHHTYCDPLAHPGDSDLTAHVDFGQLKSVTSQQILALKLMTQRDFLLSCGIKSRLDRLHKTLDHTNFSALELGLNRLISTSEMGTLFKVQIFVASGMDSK